MDEKRLVRKKETNKKVSEGLWAMIHQVLQIKKTCMLTRNLPFTSTEKDELSSTSIDSDLSWSPTGVAWSEGGQELYNCQPTIK